MRTLTPIKSKAVSISSSARDAAPSLVSKGRKNRAKDISSTTANPSGAEGLAAHEQAVIDAAIAILMARLRRAQGYANSPAAARKLATLHLAGEEREGFAVMFFDAQNGLIALEVMFRGTLTQTSVFPREVIRATMRHNAASVIFAHNHPSGSPEPSEADKYLTATLKEALALIDVRVMDHLIVGGDRIVSFAEHGLL